jgi:glycosyltransferase involved in cell wall biosynthesis
MKILFLTPQPFYEVRGTPIAVNLLLKVLSRRGEEIDLVTYHLGDDVDYENVTLHRIRNIPFVREISAGFSVQKLICDFFLFWEAAVLISRSHYHLIHAVEESAFMAYILKKIWGTEYVYDMDSRLSVQLLDRYPFLSPFKKLFSYLERVVIRNAKLILPVSLALVEEIENLEFSKVVELHDVSLLQNGAGGISNPIRDEINLNGILVMYVGNLERYQGIDLLLESFTLIIGKSKKINLAIVGGKKEDLQKYKVLSQKLEIDPYVQFLGPKPVEDLDAYLSVADILVSPRISGVNTPMKIYSFLESGKAIVATNLRTHTQVLDKQVAILAEPTPKEFAEGVLLAASDEKLRKKLGVNGKKLALAKYKSKDFQSTVNIIYDMLDNSPPMNIKKS